MLTLTLCVQVNESDSFDFSGLPLFIEKKKTTFPTSYRCRALVELVTAVWKPSVAQRRLRGIEAHWEHGLLNGEHTWCAVFPSWKTFPLPLAVGKSPSVGCGYQAGVLN